MASEQSTIRGNFDIRAEPVTLTDMPQHRRHAISFAEIGKIYEVSPQHAHWLVERHGFSIVANPTRLFGVLLDGKASMLRSRLACPVFLQSCELAMGSAAFRCAVRPGTARNPKILQTLNPNKTTP